jgi:polar amino acid transport system permease protein
MTPTTATSPLLRDRRRRRITYTVGIVVIVGAALLADWGTIQRNFFQPDIIRRMFPDVLTIGAKNTIIYTSLAFAFGLILALGLALMKRSSVAPFRWFAVGYIELFRGLPALVTIILVAFGLPLAFGWRIPFGTLGKGTIGLGLVAGAYMAETIRAGIEAVPRGQMEAAQSLGMSRGTAMTYIILPQAFRVIIPPLTNELVLLIKDTSLLFVIGTTSTSKELTKFARDFMTNTQNATPLAVVAVVYLLITLPLTWLVRRLEKSANKGKR